MGKKQLKKLRRKVGNRYVKKLAKAKAKNKFFKIVTKRVYKQAKKEAKKAVIAIFGGPVGGLFAVGDKIYSASKTCFITVPGCHEKCCHHL